MVGEVKIEKLSEESDSEYRAFVGDHAFSVNFDYGVVSYGRMTMYSDGKSIGGVATAKVDDEKLEEVVEDAGGGI